MSIQILNVIETLFERLKLTISTIYDVFKKLHISFWMESVPVSVPSFDPADKIFEESFREIDRDHNGYLDKAEFKQFMIKARQQHLSKHIFKIIDKDGNGKISLEEFLAFGRVMWAVVTKNNLEPYLKMIFDACDGKKKGWLTKREFYRFLKYTGNEPSLLKRRKQFKKWDTDGNGQIEFSEIMDNIDFVMSTK